MVQQGAGENLCQFFLLVLSLVISKWLRVPSLCLGAGGHRQDSSAGRSFRGILVISDRPVQGHQNTEWCFFLLVQQLYLKS